MIKKIITIVLVVMTATGFAQNSPDVFERISKEVKDFKFDTSTVPNDKMTRKITELRSLKGGFNINEAIGFKLEDERQKNEIPKAELEKLEMFFKSGNGKRWLDNSITWIYRKQFTHNELKQMVKFYKKPAGQKMAANFPIIMLQSLAAGEAIKVLYEQQKVK